uniref:Transmembrane protease serine n=2 Tax=Ornithorhynchus anatinus TaxID=9258 RepID=F6UQD9_ORNAN
LRRPGVASGRTSWPTWTIALIVFGVLAVLAVTIGLLAYYLAVDKKVFYYQGTFRVQDVDLDGNAGKQTSEASSLLSKKIETLMVVAFQNSNINRYYVRSHVIKLYQDPKGSMAQIWLMFQFPPASSAQMKARIHSVLLQMLKSNGDSVTPDPSSLRITEISKSGAENLLNSSCGIRASKSTLAYDRISGGTTALEGDWPWQASLKIRGHHRCGATLISSTWLITAAHCFKASRNPNDWTASFGTVLNPPFMPRSIQTIILHENYNDITKENDIAVVQLSKAVPAINNVHRICLPEATQNFSAGTTVLVAGWGALYENGPSPSNLQQASVEIIDTDTCNHPDVYQGLVTPTMLCAGFLEGKIDACQGDSGGPLAYPSSRDIWYLAGIVSWGEKCAEKNKPGVYTRVTAFRDWITSKTGV